MLKAVIFTAATLCSALAFAQPAPSFVAVDGVVATSSGGSAATTATAGGAITNGMIITTASTASATLNMGGCTFTLPPNSTVTIDFAKRCEQSVAQLTAGTGTAVAGTTVQGVAGFGGGAFTLAAFTGFMILDRTVLKISGH